VLVRILRQVSRLVILLLLFFALKHLVRVVDLFKAVLVHAASFVRMVLVTQLVVGAFDFLRLGSLRQSHHFVVIHVYIEVIWLG